MDNLERLVQMGEAQERLERLLVVAVLRVTEIKEQLDRIQRDDMPMLMKEVGVTSVTLTSGAVIKVEDKVEASITEENRPAAHQWLIDSGNGALIKSVVAIEFERGDIAAARELAEMMQAQHAGVSLKEAVHASTLKSFVKDELTSGRAIPRDLLGAHMFPWAKLTRPK